MQSRLDKMRVAFSAEHRSWILAIIDAESDISVGDSSTLSHETGLA